MTRLGIFRELAERMVVFTKLCSALLIAGTFAACGGSGSGGTGRVNSGTMYNVGGLVTGLAHGEGFVLQNNGAATLGVSANGSFTLALATGTTYSITVLTQPTGQICSVVNGSGTVTGDVSNIAVTCASLYSVGGNLAGLSSGKQVVLQNDGADNLTLNANGVFTFPTKIASGSGYGVSVLTQPTGENCAVVQGSGKINGANITNVSVTCAGNLYNVAAAVTGLISGRSLVLRNNGGDDLTFTNSGTKNFNTALATGSRYAVSVYSQPTGESCVVSGGTGTMPAGNVSGRK